MKPKRGLTVSKLKFTQVGWQSMTVQDGTTGDDSLLGTQDDDTLSGAEGNDLLSGLGGRDLLKGGSGNDFLVGGPGDDSVEGDLGGDDEISYDDGGGTRGVEANLAIGQATDNYGSVDLLNGIERISGSSFSDTLSGDDSANGLFGKDGSDTLFGLGGNDFALDGGAGNDTLYGGDGGDSFRSRDATTGIVVDLGAGRAQDGLGGIDTLISIERARDTVFDDTLLGSDGNYFERFNVSDGVDYINAGTKISADLPDAGAGIDYRDAPTRIVVDLQAGTVNDGWGNIDTIVNANEAYGTAFNDILRGGVADWFEAFEGRAGDDSIDGRGGFDRITYRYEEGGSGIVANLAVGSIIDTFGDTDRIINIEDFEASNADDSIVGSAGDFESYRLGSGDDTLDAANGYDRIEYVNDPSRVVVNLASGRALDGFGTVDRISGIEWVRGSKLGDLLLGSNSDDQLDGEDGADRLSGGNGDDDVDGSDGNDIVRGGGGRDTVSGSDGDDRLFGDDGNDRVSGGSGADKLWGGEGRDGLLGGGGDDRLYGGDVADVLFGGAGSDVLSGGDGNDAILAGTGADVIFGGEGADRIAFEYLSPESDKIRDFNGLDLLDLRKLTTAYASGDELDDYVRLRSSSANTSIYVDSDGSGSGFTKVGILYGVIGLEAEQLFDDGRLLLG